MKALTELFIGAVLAVVDSVTEVRNKPLGQFVREAVAPEDALGLVVTQPVSRRTEQGLVPRVPGGLTWLRPVKEEVRDGSVLVRDLHVSAVPVAVVPLRVASPRHCLLLQETEQNNNHHTAIANGLQTADIQAENFRTPQNYFFHSQLRKGN